MKKITEAPKPTRSQRYLDREKEIDKCLELNPNSGYEITTSNIGAWKAAFYQRWKAFKDKEKQDFLKLETQEQMKDFKWKYTNIDITISSSEKKITVWRNS